MSKTRKYIKRLKKSFGRIPTAPPTRIIGNRKGKGSYKRAKMKKETRTLINEICDDK